MFDITKFKSVQIKNDRYSNQIRRIKSKRFNSNNIERTVNESINNIKSGVNSFVIYGEPQCGKTEMMIALTAKIIDEGTKIILILVNDNVSLLGQNLTRFRNSAINPTPVNYLEILDEDINNKEMIIFCKKNKNDLEKLLYKLEDIESLVIIDDEADYATPNGKINKNERTKINNLIHELLNEKGIYIGVTATPARLDLNNTYNNLTERWVRFKPHANYVGINEFFPFNGIIDKYNLHTQTDRNDSPKYTREALFSFLVNASYLNCIDNQEANYSFLIHTSGNKIDHSVDYKNVIKTFDILMNKDHPNWEKYIKLIYELALKKVNDSLIADKIVYFLIENIARKTVVIMNSNNKYDIDPTNPPSLFTVIIGGNIVSRGVTFENLLSMYFTRDVKHKLQQDTYIQRARMFGNRKKYLSHFELWIPENLFNDWQRCFVYHHLALKMIEHEKKAPIWVGDSRIQPASQSSIDRSTVNIDSGEMTFNKFIWKNEIEIIINKMEPDVLVKINKIIGNEALPNYIIDFINTTSEDIDDVLIHIRHVEQSSGYHDSLLRSKGAIGGQDVNNTRAKHLILVLKNTKNEGRIIYKFYGQKIITYKNIK